MLDKIDFYKLITKRRQEDDYRLPVLEEQVTKIITGLNSNYDLRLLGTSNEKGDQYITEEERYVNFHILGAPGEGKSKFLEYHIQKDIDLGFGLCLLDPSDKGDTAQNVLNYCASIGYKKVILIDPKLSWEYGRIPCIAPLRSDSVHRSVAGVMEALALLFKGDYHTMRRIRRYLSALLRILARKELTTNDAIYFSEFLPFISERKSILGNDRDSRIIADLFSNKPRFDEYFASTVNILDVLWQEPLQSILGNSKGIDFVRAVADGWVIIVNLNAFSLTEEQSELLGIIIISQIIQAVDTLHNTKNFDKKFYLYVDEVGSFATPQIATMLRKKRKSGIRMYLAHHDYQQFEGKASVLAAIESGARIKLMFNTPGTKDRLRMIESLGYGGSIPPVVASYANSDLPKQYAVLKKNKESPVRIRIPDVETPPAASEEYIKEVLSQPFYKDARIPEGKDTIRSGATEVPDHQTIDTTDRTGRPESVGEDKKERPKTQKRKPISF